MLGALRASKINHKSDLENIREGMSIAHLMLGGYGGKSQ
jgi:hypothetical protein